ncbi:hypothetical protein F5Y18DRAFT_437123 [Xylariaceae sp. FL1019]|nr:hypothetical protein F5Y18DRAFT_437123 [Xylariaceae sp. FL1019]
MASPQFYKWPVFFKEMPMSLQRELCIGVNLAMQEEESSRTMNPIPILDVQGQGHIGIKTIITEDIRVHIMVIRQTFIQDGQVRTAIHGEPCLDTGSSARTVSRTFRTLIQEGSRCDGLISCVEQHADDFAALGIQCNLDALIASLGLHWPENLDVGALTEHQYLIVKLRYASALLRRCCYIGMFIRKVMGKTKGMEPDDWWCLSDPRGYDIELDLWIHEKGILRQQFDYNIDWMLKMYGFGRNEIQQRNEIFSGTWVNRISVLEDFHHLQIRFGGANISEVAEQLEYCYYAIRNRRDYIKHKGSNGPAIAQLAWDCEREFDFARSIVDGLWNHYNAGGQRRNIVRRSMGNNGEWRTMTDDEKLLLTRGDGRLQNRYVLFL